jgi:hypothetical protein
LNLYNGNGQGHTSYRFFRSGAAALAMSCPLPQNGAGTHLLESTSILVASTDVQPPPSAGISMVATAAAPQDGPGPQEEGQTHSTASAGSLTGLPTVPWGIGTVVQVMVLWLLAYVLVGQVRRRG